MPIQRLLQNSAFGPEAVKIVCGAFELACRDLGLNDRTDPLTELVAKKIFEVAQTGVSDLEEIEARALALLDASPRDHHGPELVQSD